MDKQLEKILYNKYPLSSIVLYNFTTIAHYAIGAFGFYLAYGFSGIAAVIGLLYFVFAMAQMYILMPFLVCPNCVYTHLENAICISGLNILAQRKARKGDLKNFSHRAKGLFCHNNLYMASLILPILGLVPALFYNFSFITLFIFASLVMLIIFRIFVIFSKIACIHCKAKHLCPNAQSMGLGTPLK
ncbi:MAG: hypothetical protein GY729_20510 [Desulfobacteraceae bacterium]|nr:hypothetical protein [Desulfobacteraceae bacterium]